MSKFGLTNFDKELSHSCSINRACLVLNLICELTEMLGVATHWLKRFSLELLGYIFSSRIALLVDGNFLMQLLPWYISLKPEVVQKKFMKQQNCSTGNQTTHWDDGIESSSFFFNISIFKHQEIIFKVVKLKFQTNAQVSTW